MTLRPQTIQSQLIASFLLFEVVALALFSGLLLRERVAENRAHVVRRMEYQSAAIATLCEHAMRSSPDHLETIVRSMLELPTINRVSISAPGGLILASSFKPIVGKIVHTQWDSFLPQLHTAHILEDRHGIRGIVQPIRVQGQLMGYLWLTPTEESARSSYLEMLPTTLIGALLVLLACTAVAMLLARSISSPLRQLLAATQRIIRDPQDTSAFPLAVQASNEATDLIIACNLMVAAIEEQRTGLNNTLALLDSMLAHAPIGVAFFDPSGRIIRANHFLSTLQQAPPSYHLGRTVEEAFAPAAAVQIRHALARVFASAEAVCDLEIAEPVLRLDGAVPPASTTWLMNLYPVQTANEGVRWAGALVVDISSRLQAEEALRKSEKLAAAGRLAASIAHEINNPLEAVTNLLYLLESHAALDPEAHGWVLGAQHEVERVSAITQQTLRFHRQSTKPVEASLHELLDSVLTLHQGRILTLHVECLRRYQEPTELLCLTGELRQLFANLIGNALDAMRPTGGRLYVRARRTHCWNRDGSKGVRVTVADTGCGMSEAVRRRIFEPFFTTKEATGTGLGLWVGAEIMAKHSVRLRVVSREATPGRAGGTVFSLYFPEHGLHAHDAETTGVPHVPILEPADLPH